MPRQNIMAFAPVRLILLAVLLVQVASVIAVTTYVYKGFPDLENYGFLHFGAPGTHDKIHDVYDYGDNGGFPEYEN